MGAYNRIKRNKYDIRFAKLIRTRDVCCQKCGKIDGSLQTSHIFSRRIKSLRWDTRNAKLLCAYHHREWHSSPCDAREWLVGIIGQDNYDKLRLMANKATKAPSKAHMDIIYDEMQQEIDYLESIPEGERMQLQFRYRYKGVI